MLCSRNSIVLPAVKAIILLLWARKGLSQICFHACACRITIAPVTRLPVCIQTEQTVTFWSPYWSCNLQLMLPELLTLNVFLYAYILTKLKRHSLVPQTQPPHEDRAIACFCQVLGLFPSVCQRSKRATVRCGEVFRLYARTVCRRMLARASSASPASLKCDKILGDIFLIWSSKFNIQLCRRQDASWSLKASRILCGSLGLTGCLDPIIVPSFFCSTAGGLEKMPHPLLLLVESQRSWKWRFWAHLSCRPNSQWLLKYYPLLFSDSEWR